MALPLFSVERLIRTHTNFRISDSASVFLKNFLEEKAKEISRKSIDLAKHADRKTIKSDDIYLAKS